MSDAFRAEVRAFLEAEWDPVRYPAERGALAGGDTVGPWHRRLQEERLVAPHYPEEYGGRGLGMAERIVVIEELVRVGAPGPGNVIGIGWAGPAILAHGTDDQKARFLEPTLWGDIIWCQLFSEPDAGSDLAGLRTRAERDGDHWLVTGQKIWSSGAAESDYGILVARTNPDVPKHRGLTFFLIDMHQPGIEIRPIRQMTGESHFNEVFFDGAVVADSDRVGEVDGGWRVVVTTLMQERINLSAGRGLLWGGGRSFDEFWDWARSRGPRHPLERDRWAELYGRHRVIELMRDRVAAGVAAGAMPGPEAAVLKLLADTFGQDVYEAVVDRMGPDGMLGVGSADDEAVDWCLGYLFSQALTIGGGTTNIQKNILGERALGLPGDLRVDTGPPRAPTRG